MMMIGKFGPKMPPGPEHLLQHIIRKNQILTSFHLQNLVPIKIEVFINIQNLSVLKGEKYLIVKSKIETIAKSGTTILTEKESPKLEGTFELSSAIPKLSVIIT